MLKIEVRQRGTAGSCFVDDVSTFEEDCGCDVVNRNANLGFEGYRLKREVNCGCSQLKGCGALLSSLGRGCWKVISMRDRLQEA